MKKNIIFLPNITVDDGKNRSAPYQYSIKSWKQWAKKNNAEVIEWTELLCPVEEMKITFQRYYAMEILEANGIEFDQVALIDSDTIVNPNAPNFFELTNNKFTAVVNDGNMDWLIRSIENYQKHLFNNETFGLTPWNYFNTGFMIMNETHKPFIKEFLQFYQDNKEKIQWLQTTYGVGTCQPVINFFIRQKKIDLKLLPYEYNMVDLPLKEILDEELTMTKIGHIYHFNCLSPDFKKHCGDVNYWMAKTYKHLYPND